MKLKKIIRLVLLGLTLYIEGFNNAEATHVTGVTIRQECLNSCTTRVHLYYNRDCCPTCSWVISPNLTWNVVSGNCSSIPTPIGTYSTQVVTEISPICPTALTQCFNNSFSLMGVQEYYSYIDYYTCGLGGCEFSLTTTGCCRNNAVTSGAASESYTVENKVSFFTGSCNNSPVFREDPLFFACQGTAFTVDQGAFDPDSDSLMYYLSACNSTDASTTVFYQPAGRYSAASPLGSTWNISMDPYTGLISFDPVPGVQVVAVLCFRVEEYRNGQLIGITSRDMQVVVTNCPANSQPVLGALSNPSPGVTIAGTTILANSAPVCFDIPLVDSDISQTKMLAWDRSLPGASFVDTSNASVSDTITGMSPVGRFCFSPPAPGLYTFIVTAQDNQCPYYASNAFPINIYYLSSCPPAIVVDTTRLNCNTFSFTSNIVCGIYPPISYQWTIGGVNYNGNSSITHTFPTAGNYGYSLIASDTFGNADTVTGNLIINLAPQLMGNLIIASGNLDECLSQCRYLTVAPGYSSYLWSNGETGIFNTVCRTGEEGIHSLSVTTATGCILTDTTLVVPSAYPDLYGFISTSTSAPLINQTLYMIGYDTTGGGFLTNLYQTTTDSAGYYFLCNILPQTVYLKAAPNVSTYPGEMPTYAQSALLWANSTPQNSFGFPSQVDFSTLPGINPGGPGFIGGFIIQGANKISGPGDPVGGVDVVAVDELSGLGAGRTTTDSNGYFAFPDLPISEYRIYADKPGISLDMDSVPLVPLTASLFFRDSLDFILHSDWLEWLMPIGIVDPASLVFDIFPNPNSGEFYVHLPSNGFWSLTFLDLAGRRLNGSAITFNGTYAQVSLPADASGIYLLELSNGQQSLKGRVVVTR